MREGSAVGVETGKRAEDDACADPRHHRGAVFSLNQPQRAHKAQKAQKDLRSLCAFCGLLLFYGDDFHLAFCGFDGEVDAIVDGDAVE